MVHEKVKDHKRPIHTTLTRPFLDPKVTLAPQGGSGSKKDISNSYEISKVKLHSLGGEQKGNNSGGCKI